MKIFVSHFSDIYKEEEAYLTGFLRYIKKVLSKAPPGDMLVRRRKGSYYYSISKICPNTGRASEQYIRKGDPLLSAYILKYCAKHLKPVLERSLLVLRRQPGGYDANDILQQLKKFEQYFPYRLPRAFTSSEQLIMKWAQEPFEPNPFHEEEETLFLTRNGEMVRSKNECLCANILADHDIFYRYESPLKLRNGRVIYPDFDILSHVNGKEFYLEIMGLMDNPGYAAKNYRKINEYADSGIIINDNLLVLFDYDGKSFNTGLLEQLIKRRILSPTG